MSRGAARRPTRLMLVILALTACKPSAPAPVLAVAGLPAAPAAPAEAIVTASRGRVELQRGPAGAWAAVKVGDKMSASDALRTGQGDADVAVEGVRLHVLESSGLQLRAIDRGAVRARIRGSLESQVEPSQGRLDVEVEGGDALAHSEGGHFYVTADGRGVIAVATVSGSVHLSSAGKSVEVHDGEVSRIVASAAPPDAPVAALRRVLLSVSWPSRAETNQKRVPISGRVETGSRVFVQGELVDVARDGAFRAEVPLRQGKQKIAVVTIDALGRRKQVENVVLRDDSLPEVTVKRKLWQWR